MMKGVVMELGYLIQDARHSLGLSVEDAAQRTNIAIGTLRAYEQGRRTPSVPTFKRLEESLSLNGHWVSTTTWRDSTNTEHELASAPGGHKRKTSFDISDAELRLKTIEKLLTLDRKTLEAVDQLLSIF